MWSPKQRKIFTTICRTNNKISTKKVMRKFARSCCLLILPRAKILHAVSMPTAFITRGCVINEQANRSKRGDEAQVE